MSLDLLSLLGAPGPQVTTADGGNDEAAAETGAMFASLLVAASQTPGQATAATTVAEAGDGAQGADQAEGDGQQLPTTTNAKDAGPTSTAVATQVTVLPGLKHPVQALELQQTAAEPSQANTQQSTATTITSAVLQGSMPLVAQAASAAVRATGTMPASEGLAAGNSSAPDTEPGPLLTPIKAEPEASPAAPRPSAAHQVQTAETPGNATVARADAPTVANTSATNATSGAPAEPEAEPEAAPTDRSPASTESGTPDTEATGPRSSAMSPQPTEQADASSATAAGATLDDVAVTASSSTSEAAGLAPEVDLASTVTTARAASTTHQASQPVQHAPVDPARIQAQVTRALVAQAALTGGDETVSLQLDPEHLGKVEVKITAQGDRLEVVFTAQSPEAEQALRDGARDLARALGVRPGTRWQHVDVKVAEAPQNNTDQDDSSPDDQDEPRQQREQRRDQDQQDPRRQRRQGR